MNAPSSRRRPKRRQVGALQGVDLGIRWLPRAVLQLSALLGWGSLRVQFKLSAEIPVANAPGSAFGTHSNAVDNVALPS